MLCSAWIIKSQIKKNPKCCFVINNMHIIIYNLKNDLKHGVVHDVKHFSIATEYTGKYFMRLCQPC